LFAAMDRQALKLVEMMEDGAKDERGRDLYDLQTRLALFKIGQEWLVRRLKLKPAGSQTEGQGITDMRAWINDPDTRKVLAQVVFEEGFVKEPPKKKGRPRKEDMPVRERFKAFQEAASAEDDSAWASMGIKD
jgi:hypothetical protein